MTRKHEHSMDEVMSKAETDYLAKLSKLNGSVEGLVSALESRCANQPKTCPTSIKRAYKF